MRKNPAGNKNITSGGGRLTNSTLVRKTALKPSLKPIKRKFCAFKRTKIKPVSDKLQKDLEEYYISRELFLRVNNVCLTNLPVCKKVATDVHHKKGRIGPLLLDTAYWLSVCRPCHDWIGVNSKLALEMGFSVSRHQK